MTESASALRRSRNSTATDGSSTADSVFCVDRVADFQIQNDGIAGQLKKIQK